MTDEQADMLASGALPRLKGLGGSLVPTPNVMEEFHKAIDDMLRAQRQENARKAAEEKKAESSAGGTTHTVNVNMGGQSRSINVVGAQDADALKSMLRQLESASGTSS